MVTFKVGDLIKGTDRSKRYAITTKGNGYGRVIHIGNTDIKVIWYSKDGIEHRPYDVFPDCFELHRTSVENLISVLK